MTSRERLFVYSALAMICGVNVLLLLGGAGAPAVNAIRSALDILGPAEGVALTGEPELIVRNAEGRLSWAENVHSKAYSIGFVSVQDVLEKLMETPQYRDEREALTQTIRDEQADWQQRAEEIEAKYENITPEDPNFDQARAEFSQLNTEYQQWQQSANERVNQMAMDQLEKAYREVLSAVDVVADERGIDIVYRFTPTDDPLPQGMSGQTMLDIRMRPVVRYPDGLDITVDVLEELALETE